MRYAQQHLDILASSATPPLPQSMMHGLNTKQNDITKPLADKSGVSSNRTLNQTYGRGSGALNTKKAKKLMDSGATQPTSHLPAGDSMLEEANANAHESLVEMGEVQEVNEQ